MNNVDRMELLGALPRYKGRRTMVVRDQDVNDIIRAMIAAHKEHGAEYDNIALNFWRGDAERTARALWDFMKKNVRYTVDDERQQLMSPGAILAIGKNDCKNYSLFIGGVLDALRRRGLLSNPISYRFASYKLLDHTPHHVFVVMQDGGREIWIDPVLDGFNKKRPYISKQDYKFPSMPIYRVSGIGATAAPTTTKKKPKKLFLRIALAPSRGAFELLVGLNFLGLATKMKHANDVAANKQKNWWENLGGNYDILLRKINQGAKKKRLLGDDDMIGLDPGTDVAIATATASPLLIKIGQFLKSLGVDPGELAATGKKILGNKIKEVVNRAAQKSQDRANVTQEQIDAAAAEADRATAARAPGGGMNWVPIAIGAGVVLYLATKKRGK